MSAVYVKTQKCEEDFAKEGRQEHKQTLKTEATNVHSDPFNR